jgi:tRNA nucleotidyltransferase (CCA-adding enzyme)
MEDILKTALKRIKPSEAERRRMKKVADKLVERVNRTCEELDVQAKAMLVGSAARGTWLNSEKDIDIFILFPEDLSRDELEKKGLAVARKVAGRKGREQYAEHPYLTTEFDGFEVDLVPCYDVADPSKIKSAVDRTPYHNRYVQERLTPRLADEVLLLKQFIFGAGAYGAELKVQGFSGYLCELLVMNYRSIKETIAAASKWSPGTIVDLEGSYPDQAEVRALFQGQPLIVIDPVDANRNVAAAVSMQNFATFIRACQDFMRNPSARFFFPREVKHLTKREVEGILRRRGTHPFCIVFKSPNIVADMLYPQLRKTERALVAGLMRAGFEVVRSDVWSNGKSIIIVELVISELPKVKVHVGPPIKVDVGDFVSEHIRSKRKFAGPFIDSYGRLIFELERRQTDARAVLEQALTERASFGRHVAEALAKGHNILEGKNISKLCIDKKSCEFISEYLTRCLPWYR